MQSNAIGTKTRSPVSFRYEINIRMEELHLQTTKPQIRPARNPILISNRYALSHQVVEMGVHASASQISGMIAHYMRHFP